MNVPRIESGMKIVDSVTMQTPVRALVQSSKDKKVYYNVDLRTNSCTCKDHTYRNLQCKLIRAVQAKIGVFS